MKNLTAAKKVILRNGRTFSVGNFLMLHWCVKYLEDLTFYNVRCSDFLKESLRMKRSKLEAYNVPYSYHITHALACEFQPKKSNSTLPF